MAITQGFWLGTVDISRLNYAVLTLIPKVKGADVISQFASFDPQLVLMDISLPFYNGCYWCTEIRKISRVPVIFISSHSDNMNIVMAMDMGGDDFIAKPFDLSVLTAKVRAMSCALPAKS